MTYKEIRYTLHDSVGTIEFNRAESLNALTATMRAELLDALEIANQSDSVRVVVLRGQGRAFSVGQDLKEMQQYYDEHGPELGTLVEEEYIPLVLALRNLQKPTVSVLQGAAVGGGMALALATDFRIISERAQLVPGFVNVALAPDTGTTFLLSRAIGYARAISVCLLGEPIRARNMVEYGLATDVANGPEELEERLQELVTKLAQGPTRAYTEIRKLFDATSHCSLLEAVRLERDVQATLARTSDHQEAVDAFLHKRSPQFEGH